MKVSDSRLPEIKTKKVNVFPSVLSPERREGWEFSCLDNRGPWNKGGQSGRDEYVNDRTLLRERKMSPPERFPNGHTKSRVERLFSGRGYYTTRPRPTITEGPRLRSKKSLKYSTNCCTTIELQSVPLS